MHRLSDYLYSNFTINFISELYSYCFHSNITSDEVYSSLRNIKSSRDNGKNLSENVIKSFIDKCIDEMEKKEEDIARKAIMHINEQINSGIDILEKACREEDIRSIKNLNLNINCNLYDCKSKKYYAYENYDEQVFFTNNCNSCSLHCLYKVFLYLKSNHYYPLLHYVYKLNFFKSFISNNLSENEIENYVAKIYHQDISHFISSNYSKNINDKPYSPEKDKLMLQNFYQYLMECFKFLDIDTIPKCTMIKRGCNCIFRYNEHYCNSCLFSCHKYSIIKTAYDVLDKNKCSDIFTKKLLINVEIDKLSYVNYLCEKDIESPSILESQYNLICSKFINKDISNIELFENNNISLGAYYYLDILEFHIKFYYYAYKNNISKLIDYCNQNIITSINVMITYIQKHEIITPILFRAKMVFIEYYICQIEKNDMPYEEACALLFDNNPKNIENLSDYFVFDYYIKQYNNSTSEQIIVPYWLYEIQEMLLKALTPKISENSSYYYFEARDKMGRIIPMNMWHYNNKTPYSSEYIKYINSKFS